MYLNFVTPVSKPLLEDLAMKTAENGSCRLINQVYDQYLSFVALEPHLFTMNVPNSYQRLHSTDEASVMQCINETVQSLFSVVATIGEIPIIRAQRGGAAEMVGNLLVEKLREQLRSRNNVFETKRRAKSYGRPCRCYSSNDDRI